MDFLFFNGPVQNGDFTFADKPGKAVGIRISEPSTACLARSQCHTCGTP
ncbi:MAG: hypothetical protein ACRDRU_24045 [Pseudonocardiaceae bacterium]